jgi:hypothetical protein
MARTNEDDELFQVPLDGFVAARDALAARLKAAGDKEGAAAARKARKPSVPAWAANQVVWKATKDWERLQRAVEDLRRTHGKPSSPEELRKAAVEQREALAAAVSRAAEFLEAQRHAASPSVVQKVGHTLLALAHGAPNATQGRLEHELPPPGFEALAGVAIAPATMRKARERERPGSSESASRPEASNALRAALVAAESRVMESRSKTADARRKRDAARDRHAELERELGAASRALDQAQRALDVAQARTDEAEEALAELRKPKS